MDKLEEKSLFELYPGVELVFQTPADQSFKFGYYNYHNLSKDGKKLLAHKPQFEGRLPNETDQVEIGYFNIESGKWNVLATSNAFNWQQGSMLQWLGPDYNSRVIFNDHNGSGYISRIIDLNSGSEKVIEQAIYGLDHNGKTAICLNFQRAFYTRAYSYYHVEDEKWKNLIPKDDKVVELNLETGESTVLFTLQDILDQFPLNTSTSAEHWMEHLMLSPGSNRFLIYHRFKTEGDKRLTTRCFIYDRSKDILIAHLNNDLERITHAGWMSNDDYVMYLIKSSGVKSAWVKNENKKKINPKKLAVKVYQKLVKPFMPRKVVDNIAKTSKGYKLFSIRDGSFKFFSLDINIDGHPSFTKDGKWMLTDTYSDSDGFRHLLLYNLQEQRTFKLGKFSSYYNGVGWRADLHPRFSFDEKMVSIDCNLKGNHQILVLNIDWERIIKCF